MNTELFNQAKTAYANKDFETSLTLFTQCLQDPDAQFTPGEVGSLYHQIGNCLTKLRDFEEAIHAYTQATTDAGYDDRGSVYTNLGLSYAALHDYEHAVTNFSKAIEDPLYPTPYKAYSGMGNAYLKLGKYAEAGSAFRNSALDEENDNPGKALTNLGICFMALRRPADAVTAYESALQFHMNADNRNKLYANLGQAYTANNQMQQAVDAFETALADKSYFLNDAASVDYQRAVGAVAQGTAVMSPVAETDLADMSGLDVSVDGAPVYHETDYATAAQDPHYVAQNYGMRDQYASSDDRFFNATEEELERYGKSVAKQDRKRRNVGLKIFIGFIIVLLLLFGAVAFAYTQGYGYPMQQTVAQQLFADKENAAGLFAADVDEDQMQTMLAPVVEDDSATVNGVERGMSTSVAYVTASTPEGSEIQYRVTMGRSGIGWKISNVELYFASQDN